MGARRQVIIVSGNSNLHFSDEHLPFLGCVTPSCVGALLHRPSTAEIVRTELEKGTSGAVEVYKVGWSRLVQRKGSYDTMSLESVLRAAQNGEARVSLMVALGQNDCFSTRTSQRAFKKSIADAVGKLARLVNPYVNEVFVSDPFDQEQKDGASYFGVEYTERVEIVRRAWAARP